MFDRKGRVLDHLKKCLKTSKKWVECRGSPHLRYSEKVDRYLYLLKKIRELEPELPF